MKPRGSVYRWLVVTCLAASCLARSVPAANDAQSKESESGPVEKQLVNGLLHPHQPLRTRVRVLRPDSRPVSAAGGAPRPARGSFPAPYRDDRQVRWAATATSLPTDTRHSDGAVARESPAGPAGDVHSPAVRFVVLLEERPVLVEAQIRVDGKPFRLIRENRIAQLLDEIAQRQRDEAQPTAPRSESAAETDTATAPAAPGTNALEEPTAASPEAIQEPSAGERLARYFAATGRVPARDEVAWYLANWVEGPVLLVLNENFQRPRAAQQPLRVILDQNEDGILSSEEQAQAVQRLLRYDASGDELLSSAEIMDAAKGLAAGRRPSAQFLPPFLLPPDMLNDATSERLRAFYRDHSVPGSNGSLWRFDADGNARWDADEVAQLLRAEPDLRLKVSFDTQSPDNSSLELFGSEGHGLGEAPARVRDSSITVALAGTALEFSAVQLRAGELRDQISLGVVRDGYPLFPEVDGNEDGRLTLRELREIPQRIAALDRNSDGAVAANELMPTVRVSVGLGPVVHDHLSTVRSVHPPAPPAPAVPEWFTRMDKNQDRDLSRREFLGTEEQFKQLDVDGDGLIDPAEAAAQTRESPRAAAPPPRESSQVERE